ncbi:hypothetical protein [Nonomuraea jiangxiensis]|nr:hypothetical protein [Nonomuraea jiangxiensis]
MTTGITGSSDGGAGKEESEVPFDPEATGVIPRLTFDPPADPEESGSAKGAAEGPSSGVSAGSADAAEAADPGAERTTAFRLPGAVRIGHAPTAEKEADTASAAGTVPTPVQRAGSTESPSKAPAPPSPKPQEARTTPQPKPSTPPAKPAQAGQEPAAPDGSQAKGGTPATAPPAKGAAGTTAPPGNGTTAPASKGAGGASPVAGTQPMSLPTVGGESGEGASSAGASSGDEAPAGKEPGRLVHPVGAPALAPRQAPPAAPQQAPGTGPQQAPGTAPQQAPAQGLQQAPAQAPAPGVAPQQAPGTGPQQAPGIAPQQVPGTGPQQGPGIGPQQGEWQGAGGGLGQAAGARAGQGVGQRSGAAAGPAGRIGALVASAPKWLPVLLVLEGLLMYILALKVPPGPLRGVNPANIDGLGLISALPVSAFVAILIMIVSFFVTVAQSTDRKFLLLFQIAAITFALHGAGALVSSEPRFPTAYIHAGFVEFIARTGESAINIDARMGWPGFFALFAFVTKAAGITDLTTILQWTPLLSNLLYLLPFVLILRQVVATTRARWFAALLFVLVQWIGQDYFSPQGFTFALYLAWVAILLRWFGRVEPRTKPIPPKGLRKLLGRLDAMTPGELANTGTFRADKLLMLMMLLALFFASTASHQITPFMMLGVVTAFLIFRRTSLTWALPFFLGLVVLAWISYMTVGFWASQIDTIFGGLGNILANLRSNTGDRIEGTDPAHTMVLQARLGILVVILALAATGLFRRLRRGVFDRSALILLCVPVLALGLQSYGGEIGLRIYMFALPGACLLAAYAFFPNLPADSADVREETVPLRKRNVRFNPELTKKLTVVLAACFAVIFAMAFLLARYGNEKFERVTTGEVAAMRYIYDHDQPSARVVYLVPKLGPEVTPTMPWGEQDIERVNFGVQALVHKDPTRIADAVASVKAQPRNTYLIVSTGQVSYLQLNEGYPDDWGQRFRAALDASPDLKRVYSNADAALYTWKNFVRGTEIPEPSPYQGRGDPTTPWTPVGIGALAVTWVALLGYEIIRLNGPNRARKARKRLLFLAVPGFVVALAVIVERFIYIAANN